MNCNIETKGLIENEDMKNFLRLIAVYRNLQEKNDDDAERYGALIDMIIENVNAILARQKKEKQMADTLSRFRWALPVNCRKDTTRLSICAHQRGVNGDCV